MHELNSLDMAATAGSVSGLISTARTNPIHRRDFSPDSLAPKVTRLTADPEVASSILARFHTFLEIDHEIISTVIILPSADSKSVVVSYKP